MNRHLKIAFFMAPVLALGAYAITGYFMPRQAASTAGNQLALLGQCEPLENACLFQAGDLEIKLISNEKQQQQQLAAFSNEAISDFSLALGDADGFVQFPMMKTENNKYWQIKLTSQDRITKYKQIRLAFKHEGLPYFAESKVQF